MEIKQSAVIRKTSYGNFTVTQLINGDFVVTRFGQYVTTTGSEQSAIREINRLIQ